ncbi:aminopeptidase N [Massilia sp. W12]|uniref:aminopeptidase N n=1 Tax=Massilia sp. W12 TaxID=3126507 RepID=UPI0030CF2955
MRTDSPHIIYRKDYTPPAYLVETVEIGFDLDPDATRVATRLTMQRNPAGKSRDIHLHGEGLKLVRLWLNGKQLKRGEYQLDKQSLTIPDAPKDVVLDIETLIAPAQNTSLNGLYTSNNNFYTQCEAEGFRKITYFPDRPDVMAKYTVMLRADKKQYPVLLSNGNLLEEGMLDDGRHYAKWEDPFKKPSYLFALVAGKFEKVEQWHTLRSGRKVLLQIWVEAANLDKVAHAMESLVNSIRWDEERFGLELDLDRFMIVAVGDFNMGAMENKGLNIFNTKYVLANQQTATDTDFANIEAVVGHEYFHNWTGNRVTCRDWFQLSLKEGLTVFRDQEFSADMIGTPAGRAVSRIDNVRVLRQSQFPEDAGPMAHPVRPDAYAEINNFYTLTVYEKGSEVVRMYQTLVGRDGFRKGMDLYFQRHDGQAVTCDDFRAAMADANGRDLKQFERWYSQSGTPHVKVKSSYDEKAQVFELTISQSCPATPGQPKKQAFHIPLLTGLVGPDGRDLPLYLEGAPHTHGQTSVVLELTKTRQTFRFLQVAKLPVPSVLRDFSAPVVLDSGLSESQLLHLFKYDSDPFNRWEAGQQLLRSRLLAAIRACKLGQEFSADPLLIEAMRSTLMDSSLDPAYRDVALTLPSEVELAELQEEVDPQAIRKARNGLRRSLAQALQAEFLQTYQNNQRQGAYKPDAGQAGQRALKNHALNMLLQAGHPQAVALAQTQCEQADNMTDRFGALSALINMPESLMNKSNAKVLEKALARFYKDFQKDALVIDKWFSLQATAESSNVDAVRALLEHTAFTYKTPNRVNSVITVFCKNNLAQFHAPDGSGYEFWADQVIALNSINPQVAARVARALDRWRLYAKPLQQKMEVALQRVYKTRKLSKDVAEIIGKALGVL